MALTIHKPKDLAALNVLLFMPDDGVSTTDRIGAYTPIMAAYNVPNGDDFRTFLASDQILTDYCGQQPDDLFSDTRKAMKALMGAINTQAQAYAGGAGGNPANVDLIGWSSGRFSIVNQVAFMGVSGFPRVAAEENKYQELGALNLVILRNSTNGSDSFASFADQLNYYLPQARALPALDPFRVAMEGIAGVLANPATSILFDTAQGSIRDFLMLFHTLATKKPPMLEWTNCGYSSLAEIDLWAQKGLIPRPVTTGRGHRPS